METLKISLISDDMTYAKAFAGGIADTHPEIIISIYESSESEMAGFTSQLIIFDSYVDYTEVVNIENIPHIFLSEKGSDEINEIYRYESLKNVGNQIIRKYIEISGNILKGLKSTVTSVISVISHREAAGNTTVAQALSDEIAFSKDMNVLYIECSKFAYRESDSIGETRNLKEIIYYAIADRKKMLPTINDYIIEVSDKIDGFCYGEYKNPLSELSYEEADLFLDKIMPYLNYRYIVVDVGTETSAFAEKIIGQSCVCVKLITEHAQIRDDRIEKFWEKSGIEEKKVIACRNKTKKISEQVKEFFEEGKKETDNEEADKIDFFIPFGSFKSEIRKIAELICKEN